MFIKLCGTTNLDDAQLAVDSGADALGFIFAPSKRRVSVEQAAAITALLPKDIERVGVFTDANTETILATAKAAVLTTVQLHHTHEETLLAALDGQGLQLWQVVPYEIDPHDRTVSDETFIRVLITSFEDTRIAAVLIDAAKAGASGGTGQSFDWKHVRGLVDRALDGKKDNPRILLAGGLRPENVAEAIGQFHPWGVDVVSGVEAGPGRKDAQRVQAFLRAARSTHA